MFQNKAFLHLMNIIREASHQLHGKPRSKCLGRIESMGNVLLEQRPDSKPHAEIRASRLIGLQKWSEQ